MTTDTNIETSTHDAGAVIDIAALRLDVLTLLARANEALMFTPDSSTAREYAERLYNVNEDIRHATYCLAHALPALRMLIRAGLCVARRADGLSEVFHSDFGVDDELTSDIGEGNFWGDIAPVFPELHMDFSPIELHEDHPF